MRNTLAATLFCICLLLIPSAQAVGISPAIVVVDEMLAGTTTKKVVNFSRGNPSGDEKARVVIEGPAAKYIVPEKGEVFVLPKGQNTIPYPFTIHAEQLPSGTYEASISIAPIVTNDLKISGNKIIAGARGKIRFTVTNQEKQIYTIDDIFIGEFEENQPIGMTYTIRNTGNAAARPSKIDIEVVDLSNPAKIFTHSIPLDKIQISDPFKDSKVSISMEEFKLPRGEFRVMVLMVNEKGEQVAKREFQRIEIWPAGTLEQKGEFTDFKADKESYSQGEIAQLTGQFKNIGNVGLSMVNVLEIFKGEKRLDVIKNKAVFVPIGETIPTEYNYRITEGGSFTIKAYASYGAYKSSVLEAKFSVQQFGVVWVIVILIGGSLGVLFFIRWWKGRKKQLRQK